MSQQERRQVIEECIDTLRKCNADGRVSEAVRFAAENPHTAALWGIDHAVNTLARLAELATSLRDAAPEAERPRCLSCGHVMHQPNECRVCNGCEHPVAEAERPRTPPADGPPFDPPREAECEHCGLTILEVDKGVWSTPTGNVESDHVHAPAAPASVGGLVERLRAALTPELLADIAQDQSLTYGEVAERLAEKLAVALSTPPAEPPRHPFTQHELLILIDECRDAIQCITMTQLRLHNISPTLAERIDAVVDKANEFNKAATLPAPEPDGREPR